MNKLCLRLVIIVFAFSKASAIDRMSKIKSEPDWGEMFRTSREQVPVTPIRSLIADRKATSRLPVSPIKNQVLEKIDSEKHISQLSIANKDQSDKEHEAAASTNSAQTCHECLIKKRSFWYTSLKDLISTAQPVTPEIIDSHRKEVLKEAAMLDEHIRLSNPYTAHYDATEFEALREQQAELGDPS